MSFVPFVSLLAACLVNQSLYDDRLDALRDDDGDGW